MTLRLFRNNLGSGVLASSLILFSSAVAAQSIEDEAVAWLQDFIRVDTVNPPGNETRAVEFYREIFDAEGIEYDWGRERTGSRKHLGAIGGRRRARLDVTSTYRCRARG